MKFDSFVLTDNSINTCRFANSIINALNFFFHTPIDRFVRFILTINFL